MQITALQRVAFSRCSSKISRLVLFSACFTQFANINTPKKRDVHHEHSWFKIIQITKFLFDCSNFIQRSPHEQGLSVCFSSRVVNHFFDKQPCKSRVAKVRRTAAQCPIETDREEGAGVEKPAIVQINLDSTRDVSVACILSIFHSTVVRRFFFRLSVPILARYYRVALSHACTTRMHTHVCLQLSSLSRLDLFLWLSFSSPFSSSLHLSPVLLHPRVASPLARVVLSSPPSILRGSVLPRSSNLPIESCELDESGEEARKRIRSDRRTQSA